MHLLGSVLCWNVHPQKEWAEDEALKPFMKEVLRQSWEMQTSTVVEVGFCLVLVKVLMLEFLRGI